MMGRKPRLSKSDAMVMLGAGTAHGLVMRAERPKAIHPPRNPIPLPKKSPALTRVLGLDLSINTTGWCMLVDGQPSAHGYFTLPQKRKNERLAAWLLRRCDELERQIRHLMAVHAPDCVAFEYPDTYRRVWSGGSKGREFVVAQALGRAQGFLLALWPFMGDGKALVAISTSDAKRIATGRVDANKDQVRYALMTYRKWDLSRWTDDESDAAAVALAAYEGGTL